MQCTINLFENDLEDLRKSKMQELCPNPHERRIALRYYLTGVVDPHCSDKVYIKPSNYLAKNSTTGSYDRDIGLSLFTKKVLSVNEKLGNYVGEIFCGEDEHRRRVEGGIGCYIVDIGNGYFLDCFNTVKLGLCLMSFGNSNHDLVRKDNNNKAAINAHLGNPQWKNGEFISISLFASKTIQADTEVFYSYNSQRSKYSFDYEVISPLNPTRGRELLVSLSGTQQNKEWYGLTQATGFCFYLTLLQLIYDMPKIDMRVPDDRRFVENNLRNLASDAGSMSTLFSLVADYIQGLGSEVFRRIPWMSQDTGFWPGTMSLVNRNILTKHIDYCFWELYDEMKDNRYMYIGLNETVEDNAKLPFYSDLRDKIFNENRKHFYFRGGHYFPGPDYQNHEFWMTNLDSAINDAIEIMMKNFDELFSISR